MKNLFLIVFSFTFASCATVVVPQATGGSRADGVVEFSYSYGGFQVPEPDWVTADQQAISRCAVWGYTGAERFGGGTQQCTNVYAGSCNAWMVTVSYQCTGQSDN